MIMKRVIVILLLLLVIALSSPIVFVHLVAAERDDHRCYFCLPFSQDCPDCDGAAGRCCSVFNYCGTGDVYCKPCYNDIGVYIDPCSCHKEFCKHATHQFDHGDHHGNYTYYNATLVTSTNTSRIHRDEDYVLVATYNGKLGIDNVSPSDSHVSNVSSSPLSVDEGHEWVREYGSAAICGPLSSSTTTVSTDIVPGQCLLVTNVENGKQAKVKIIDKLYCKNTSLALDYDVFQQLFNTSASEDLGVELPVSYKYVDCIDN